MREILFEPINSGIPARRRASALWVICRPRSTVVRALFPRVSPPMLSDGNRGGQHPFRRGAGGGPPRRRARPERIQRPSVLPPSASQVNATAVPIVTAAAAAPRRSGSRDRVGGRARPVRGCSLRSPSTLLRPGADESSRPRWWSPRHRRAFP